MLGVQNSPCTIENVPKKSFLFPFYLLLFTFFPLLWGLLWDRFLPVLDNNAHAGSWQPDGASGTEQLKGAAQGLSLSE